MTTLEVGSATAGGERRAPPQPDQDPLPCPRCQSRETKFCYYNNYNLSQPRYFCKSCRRYWTRGGALRNVPVGGGSRKSAKRSRTASPATSSTTASPTTSVAGSPSYTVHTYPVYSGQMMGGCGGGGEFTSLLAMGGFGFGLGLGLEEAKYGYGYGYGYGIGNSGRVLPENTGVTSVESVYGGSDDGGVTWHGEGDGGGGDYYSALPELAISTPGNGVK